MQAFRALPPRKQAVHKDYPYVDAELATGFHHELRTKANARRSCLSDLAQAPPHHPCQALRKGSGVSWKLAIQNPRFVEQQVRSVLPKRGVVLAC